MPKDTVLFENKWISVIERELDNSIKWVFGHHSWCNGKGVAILPFRQDVVHHQGYGKTVLRYLGCVEICPAHSPEPKLCAVAGGMDKYGEMPVEVAARELYEETGYHAEITDFIFLGSVRPSKGTDTEMFLFAVDVTDLPKSEPTGDGSLIEATASTEWINEDEAVFSQDPLLATMVARLEVYNRG